MMALRPGTRLGPYEIVAPLGAGGMGEVYRARDTRLGRDVAIKVLPQRVSASPEDRARFKREAKTISSLNHPHICVLHDIGREGGTDYLVMELVDGETLSRRLLRGPLPPVDILKIGSQIADALDRAHRAGVIHRDLKPGNIMLTKGGAKLMDFGLARSPERANRAGTTDVTETAPGRLPGSDEPITTEGTIVGTFQYMAPEQLEGRGADARSDIWSLGCVLYEMTTRKKAFEGSTSASLISAIMRDPPRGITDLAPMTPPLLEHTVLQCLMKDPDERWQSAGDLRSELQWITRSMEKPTGPAGRGKALGRPWRVFAVCAAAAVSVVGVVLALHPGIPTRTPVRFAIQAPPGSWMTESASNMAISPDGRTIAFVGGDSSGRQGLWLRHLSDMTPSLLEGTTDATYPFWSPDSRNVAFFAEGKLKRVSATGGTVEAICDVQDARGGSWGSRGVIVFSPGSNSPLEQVNAEGGSPRAAAPPGANLERFPCFLPDGRHFLGLAGDGVVVGSLDSSNRAAITKARRAAIYAAPGYLIFEQGGALVAQHFNSGRLGLEGDPIRLTNSVAAAGQNLGERVASASGTGSLVFPTQRAGNSQLIWSDRRGKTVGTQRLPAGSFADPRLSPDGRRIAMTEQTGSGPSSIWIYDIAHGAAERLTFGPGNDRSPVWSPDGNRILYGSELNGFSLRVRRADAVGEDSLLFTSEKGWIDPSSWSRDGNYATFVRAVSPTGFDIWTLPMHGSHVPTPYLRTHADEKRSDISPDGHWLAYQSNESGRFEIYVQSFPRLGVKYQVSSTGGQAPLWSRDGKELFYQSGDGQTVVTPVSGSETLSFGAPTGSSGKAPARWMRDTSEGPRFLSIRPVRSDVPQSLTVIENWAAIAGKGP